MCICYTKTRKASPGCTFRCIRHCPHNSMNDGEQWYCQSPYIIIFMLLMCFDGEVRETVPVLWCISTLGGINHRWSHRDWCTLCFSSFGGINHRWRRRLLVLSLNPPLLSHQEEQSPDKPIVIGQQSLWTGSLCTLYVVQRILTLHEMCIFAKNRALDLPPTSSTENRALWLVSPRQSGHPSVRV